MCREIFGRWYIWASHPVIKHPLNPQREREVLIDLHQTIALTQDFNKAQTDPASLLLLFLFLLPLAFYSRSAQTHAQPLTHRPSLQLLYCTKPHLPREDRWIQTIHHTLALRKWSSVWSTGGGGWGESHIYMCSLLKFPVVASSVGRCLEMTLWAAPSGTGLNSCRAQVLFTWCDEVMRCDYAQGFHLHIRVGMYNPCCSILI